MINDITGKYEHVRILHGSLPENIRHYCKGLWDMSFIIARIFNEDKDR